MQLTEAMSERVGQFVGLYEDTTVSFGRGLTFRVIVYGAEQMGAICPEYNGVAVLREGGKTRKKEPIYTTVASRLARANSGYYGMTQKQKELFESLRTADFDTFQETLGLRLSASH